MEAKSGEALNKSIATLSKFLNPENLFLVHSTHYIVFDKIYLKQLATDFESK